MPNPFYVVIIFFISTFIESTIAKIKIPTAATDYCPVLGIYDCTTY